MDNELICYLVTLSSIDHPNPLQFFPINLRVLLLRSVKDLPKESKIHYHVVPVNYIFRF